jgi:hypothetical protein
MESIVKLEEMAAERYKGAPHLSKSGQKWLATNVWWITLVGVILGGFGILSIIAATFFASALLVGYAGIAGTALAGLAFSAVLVTLAFSVVVIVLMLMAISPLKALNKKGWNLLFLVLLLQIASLVITFLFNYSLMGLIWGLIMAAIGGYFLFEIREYFTGVKKVQSVKTPETK